MPFVQMWIPCGAEKNARISWTKNKTEFYSQAGCQNRLCDTNDTTLVARTSEEPLELMKRVKDVSEQFKPYVKVEKTTIMI